MDARELRSSARISLKGKWGISILAYLVYGVLFYGLLFSGGSSASNSAPVADSTSISLTGAEAVAFLGFLVILLVVLIGVSLLTTVLFSPVLLGYTSYNMELGKGGTPGVGTLFSLYQGNFGRAFSLVFFKNLFTALWTLLLLFPGVIAYYRYAMAEYLMVQNPNLSGREAIAKSKEMMRGHKAELFVLQLSFIGWAFLSVVTMGIGFLWLMPYMEQAKTQFFFELSQNAVKNPM